MLNLNNKLILLTYGLTIPQITFAQPADFKGAVGNLTDFLLTLVPILISIALLVFFWGLAEYVFSAADEVKEGSKQRMLWGVIGLFTITSIWAIVTLFGGSIGITP
ncbi:MAG: hypothetical protein WD335_02650 [Candidatus Paceibacterota bacterium]